MRAPDARFLEAERRVHAAIASLDSEYQKHLQELVCVPSPMGEEARAQTLVERHMRDLGLAVDVFDIDPVALGCVPGFNRTSQSYSGRPCVVGTLEGSGAGQSLILNAHVDTALVEDPHTWIHPPYGGHLEDGKLYGRGAWDDKAGIVECLLIVEALRRAGIRLRGDLILKSVVEDERTGNGTLACIERGFEADGAIIVDGTWPERFIVSHMGGIWFRVQLRGRPAHGARPGANPVDAIGPLVASLRRMVARTNEGRDVRWGDVDRPAYLNIGRVQAGAWPGAIPSGCVIDGLFGFAPPDTAEIARDKIRHTIEEAAADARWPLDEPPALEFWGLDVSPLVGSAENDIVKLLVETVGRLHDKPLVEHVVAGHCDLRHYTRNHSRPPTPACLYGPGGGRNAHAPDEYFVVEHLGLVARNLATAALAWCGFD